MRTGTYDVENTTLPSPVITQVLRIVPLEWSPSNFVVCLKLEAIGCPFFQGMIQLHMDLFNVQYHAGSKLIFCYHYDMPIRTYDRTLYNAKVYDLTCIAVLLQILDNQQFSTL